MKFSIITATFNSQQFIESCVKSVLNQSYPNIELIIVDGASSDNTLQIIQSFNNPKIKIHSERDNGIYFALNKGVSLASGDVIGFLHSDDFFVHENVIEEIAGELQNSNIHGVYSNLKYVHHSNPKQIIRNWKSKPFKPINLKFGWMPPHPTLFLKREVYDTIGWFNTNYRIAADYDWILRVFTDSRFTIKYLDMYISDMRIGGASNGSVKSIINKSREDYLVIQKYHLWGWLTLISKNVRKLPQLLGK